MATATATGRRLGRGTYVGYALGSLFAGENGPEFLIDAGRGLVSLRVAASAAAPLVIERLREKAAGLGGQLVVTSGLQFLGAGVDAWGLPAAGGAIARRIKEQFDPQGTLNPGRAAGCV